jgi:hypothetical protein
MNPILARPTRPGPTMTGVPAAAEAARPHAVRKPLPGRGA